MLQTSLASLQTSAEKTTSYRGFEIFDDSCAKIEQRKLYKTAILLDPLLEKRGKSGEGISQERYTDLLHPSIEMYWVHTNIYIEAHVGTVRMLSLSLSLYKSYTPYKSLRGVGWMRCFRKSSRHSQKHPSRGLRVDEPRRRVRRRLLDRCRGMPEDEADWSNEAIGLCLLSDLDAIYIDSIPSFIHLPPSCRSFKDFLSCTVCRKKKEVSYWQVRHLTEPGLTVWGFAGLSVSQVSVESAWSAWSKGLTKQIRSMSGTTESSRNTCLFFHKPTNCKVGFQMDTPAIA